VTLRGLHTIQTGVDLYLYSILWSTLYTALLYNHLSHVGTVESSATRASAPTARRGKRRFGQYVPTVSGPLELIWLLRREAARGGKDGQ
jgi:hypothetical protein